MFQLADNAKIGQYLKKRIDERFESHRQFCKTYLEAMGEQADDDRIRNMSNRLSQILNGKKGIQLSDLPLFCRLLEISCENILSAGESCAPTSAHLTNYAVAFSKEKWEWEDYVTREDSPVLNADEYGKTVIDYALEAENYDFLRYLMEQNYIWFVSSEGEDGYSIHFGAGTSIKEKNFPYPSNLNVLNVRLQMRDELRTHMIALAIQHEDLDMLDQLHAREIPTIHQSFYWPVTDDCEKYYNGKLMEALSHASDTILEYFSKEFEISDQHGHKNRFLFPFIGELMERLLQNKNSFAEYMLKDAIRHNQYVYDQLVSLLSEATQCYMELDGYDIKNEAVKSKFIKEILRDLYFYDNGNLVRYFGLIIRRDRRRGMISNIVRVNFDSTDTTIKRRILELNEWYDAIQNIMPTFEGVKKNADF